MYIQFLVLAITLIVIVQRRFYWHTTVAAV